MNLVDPNQKPGTNLKWLAFDVVALQTFAALTLLVQSIALARFLGPDGYGLIYTSVATASVLGVLSTLGWPATLMKRISQASAHMEVPNWIVIAIVDTAIALSILLAITFSFGYTVSFWPLVILSTSRSALLIIMGVMQGFHHSRLFIAVANVGVPLFATCFSLIVNNYILLSSLSLYAIGTGMYVLLFGLIGFQRSLLSHYNDCYKGWRFTISVSRSDNLIVYLSSVGNVLLSFSDVIDIGKFLPSAEAGRYGIAIALTSLIPLCMPAINAMYGPAASLKIKAGDTDGAKKVFKNYRMVSTMWSTVIAAIIISMSFLILPYVYNIEMDHIIFIVIITLSVGQLINCLTGPVSTALYVNECVCASSLPIAIYGILHVFLIFYVTAHYGIVGASITTMLGISGVNLFQYAYASRRGIL